MPHALSPASPLRVAALLAVWLVAASATAQTDAASRAKAEGRFVRALTAQALGDESAAAGVLDEVLATAPDDPTVLLLRAEVASTPADAVYYARQSADAAPDRADVWLGLARALREAGQPAGAADALDTAQRLAPDDLDVLLAVAELAAEQRDGARERDALERLVRIGDSVGARLRLSALAEAAGDLDQALDHARAAARLAPSDPTVRRRLAQLERPATDPAVADAPADASPPPSDAPAPAASRTGGAALFAAGRYAEAADALLAELDEDPRRVDAWALVLQALARTADPRAGATADDALLLFASVPAVVVGAAEAYQAAGRDADARDTAQRGLDALDWLGDAVPDASALRARLDALLSR